MSEKEKVLQVVENYKEFFDGNDGIDVAISVKGEFFFYSFNEKYNYYDHFIQFHTAEQLERIIIGNMVNDANCIIEPLADELEMQTRNIQDVLKDDFDFKDEIVNLSRHLASVEQALSANGDIMRILLRGMKNVCDRVNE